MNVNCLGDWCEAGVAAIRAPSGSNNTTVLTLSSHAPKTLMVRSSPVS
jgi:hypothetical protein